MTATTCVQPESGSGRRTGDGELGNLIRWAQRVSDRLRCALRSAAGLARGEPSGRLVISTAAARELASIRTAAHFIAKNPGMPVDHRTRFLATILRGCEELSEELARPATK